MEVAPLTITSNDKLACFLLLVPMLFFSSVLIALQPKEGMLSPAHNDSAEQEVKTGIRLLYALPSVKPSCNEGSYSAR